MTGLCAGGTSGPKTGVAAVVDYSSGLIASILAFRGLGWLIPVIPLAGLPPLVLSVFCGTDPPAMPTFTAAETLALTQLTFGTDFDSGLSKLVDLMLHSIWYDACQCNSGTLTTYPTITPPVGTPIFQPPVTASTTCQTYDDVRTRASGADVLVQLPSLLGSNPTYVVLTATVSGLTGGAAQSTTAVESIQQPSGAATAFVVDHHLVANNGVQFITTGFVPSTCEHLQIRFGLAGSSTSATFTTHVDVYCGANRPGGVVSPCCPPDVSTQASLDLILKMVTLIQRQAVPFAYLPSTSHPTLTGAGSFDISGLIGAAIQVTILPTPIGREGTSPTEYFDMGFITFGTPDGYPTSYRLERSAQVMFPARCGAYTTLAYDLHAGVEVTITELVREP